jgi:hypothetical protein
LVTALKARRSAARIVAAAPASERDLSRITRFRVHCDKLADAYEDPGVMAEFVDNTGDSSIAALAERVAFVDHVVSTASARSRGPSGELARLDVRPAVL